MLCGSGHRLEGCFFTGCRSSKTGRWRDGGRAHRRLLAVSCSHHGGGSRPGYCPAGILQPWASGPWRRSTERNPWARQRSEGLLRARRSRACPSCARWPHPCARRLWRGCSSAKCLQGRPSFWPRGGFPRSVHFVNPPPTEAVGRRPHRGRWGAAHKGGGWGSPTEGADFFARWVRQACGSAPLGGWGLSGAIWTP